MPEYQVDSIKLESGLNGVIVYVNCKCKGDENRSTNQARFDVKNLEEFIELIRRSIGVTPEQFLHYQFGSLIDRFDEALKDKIYNTGPITPDNIEDRILVPALDARLVPDTNLFPYKPLDKYWDKCIATGLLTIITKRDYNNYYDSEKWCEHMNTKLKNVTLSHVNEDTRGITVKPRGSSYWYIKINYNDANFGNKDVYALCGFWHSFILYD